MFSDQMWVQLGVIIAYWVDNRFGITVDTYVKSKQLIIVKENVHEISWLSLYMHKYGA